MNKKTKRTVMFVILILLLLGVGYASLRTNLTINGTSTIKNNNFIIKFSNIIEKSGSVEPTKTATIGTDNTSVSFDVTLTNPGDYYGFNIDVLNSGTLDAMVETFEKTELTETQQKYLSYEITYSDGTPITAGDVLTQNNRKTISVLLTYKENPEEYPTTSEQTLTFNFAIIYIEAGENASGNGSSNPDAGNSGSGVVVERVTANTYAQSLPTNLTSTINLYTTLTPQVGYYTATEYDNTSSTGLRAVSIVIPVVPGDKIQSSSFNDTTPPTGGQAGIRVTYLNDNTIVSSLSPTEVNSEYKNNNCLTIPAGVNAVSIAWWEPSDENWAYLIS